MARTRRTPHPPAGAGLVWKLRACPGRIMGFRLSSLMYVWTCYFPFPRLAVECAWKLTALLRSRKYHDVPRPMLLYKAQLLSYIEYRTPAIYHAACSVLEPVDGVQQRFLRETYVSEEEEGQSPCELLGSPPAAGMTSAADTSCPADIDGWRRPRCVCRCPLCVSSRPFVRQARHCHVRGHSPNGSGKGTFSIP